MARLQEGGPVNDSALRYMARGAIVERLAIFLADEHGAECADDLEVAREQAEEAVDVLIEDGAIFASERWDEDCHRCERRIGDHFVDGRCPS